MICTHLGKIRDTHAKGLDAAIPSISNSRQQLAVAWPRARQSHSDTQINSSRRRDCNWVRRVWPRVDDTDIAFESAPKERWHS